MYSFWKNVDGVSMTSVGKRFRKTKLIKPEISQLDSKDLLSDERAIFWIDLNDITSEELQNIYAQEIIPASRNGSFEGICLWFTCQFPTTDDKDPVILSTSPHDVPTHWKQTIIVLPDETEVEVSAPICFEINIKRSEEYARRYNIELQLMNSEEVVHPEPCECYMTKCIIIKKMLESYENNEIKTND